MKTRISGQLLLVSALLTGPCFNGFGQVQTNESSVVKGGTNWAPATTAVESVTAPNEESNSAAVADADTNPSRPSLSPWANELAKMAQAGIGDNVLLAYIDSVGTFNLGPDQIVYLRNLGVSNDAINAALQHDADIASGQRQVVASTVPLSGSKFPKSFLVSTPGPSARTVPTSDTSAVAPFERGASAEDSIVTELPEADDGSIATILPDKNWLGLFTWIAQGACGPARNTKPYPVREARPVKLTKPIIVLNAAGRTPNLLVIEGLP